MTHAPLTARLTLALLATTGLAGPLMAQEDDRWYQVEIIAFARESADEAAEEWPRNLSLRYPLNTRALRDPRAPDAGDEGDVPSWDRGLSQLDPQAPTDLAREPFFRLPENEREMNRYADALDGSDDYRVLFHEAWRQPVAKRGEGRALLIRGGERHGNHTELEGSLSLGLSRYLHLNTRLWLTEFEPNYGQAPGTWPELPRHPEQQAGTTPPRKNDDWQATAWEGDWSSDSPSGQTAWDQSLNTTSSLPDFFGEEYLPSRIVTMNQQRRMRSEETHYIDHPLFGLVVRILPYERPEETSENGD